MGSPLGRFERTTMKKTIAAIGLAIGLSFAGAGIADASVTPAEKRCAQAEAALAELQKKAADEKNPVRREILLKMVDGAAPAVKSQCDPPSR